MGLNVLFIGGTGNISADCAALLHRRGNRIYVISRGKSAIPSSYTGLIADRHDTDTLQRVLDGIAIDVVINFLGFDVADLEIDHKILEGKIKQYIFISSTTVYAKPHRSLPLTEGSPTGNAFSEYAQNKQACEEWLLVRFKETGFPITIVRPSHTYSPRWIPNPVSSAHYTMVARLEQKKPIFVHDDGQGLWTLTATSDFAVGLAGLAGNEAAIGETFHITSDQVLTWDQIYEEIYRAAKIRHPKILHVPTDFICKVSPEMTAKLKGDKAEPGVFDNAKIKKFVPDYDCRKTFRQGITESVAWFRQDRSRTAVDPQADKIYEQVTSAWLKERG